MAKTDQARSTTISLNNAERALVDAAAKQLNVSRSELLVSAGMAAARAVLPTPAGPESEAE